MFGRTPIGAVGNPLEVTGEIGGRTSEKTRGRNSGIIARIFLEYSLWKLLEIVALKRFSGPNFEEIPLYIPSDIASGIPGEVSTSNREISGQITRTPEAFLGIWGKYHEGIVK